VDNWPVSSPGRPISSPGLAENLPRNDRFPPPQRQQVFVTTQLFSREQRTESEHIEQKKEGVLRT
jgi:ribosome maturation factor RimP